MNFLKIRTTATPFSRKPDAIGINASIMTTWGIMVGDLVMVQLVTDAESPPPLIGIAWPLSDLPTSTVS